VVKKPRLRGLEKKWTLAIQDEDAEQKKVTAAEGQVATLESELKTLVYQLESGDTHIDAARRARSAPLKSDLEGLFSVCETAHESIDTYLTILPRLKLLFDGQEPLELASEELTDSLEVYLQFAGDKDADYFKRCEARSKALQDLLETIDVLDYSVDEPTCTELAVRAGTVLSEVKQATPLLPDRRALRETKANQLKVMNDKFSSLQQLVQSMTAVQGQQDKKKNLETLRDEQKKLCDGLHDIDTTHAPEMVFPKVKALVDGQEQLDQKIDALPDLKRLIVAGRLTRLRLSSTQYADLLKALLDSNRVLDKFNVERELKSPETDATHRMSRLMELQYLVDALRNGAVVQVGRMQKAALAEALRAQNLDAQATEVEGGQGSEFAADGIIWYADRMEAVQHKRTTSTRPLEARRHGTGEINLEGELVRQLRDAANQLSGLTAGGARRRAAQFGSTVPEVPPRGLNRVRLANLSFVNVNLPVVDTLADYTATIGALMRQQQSVGGEQLGEFVELIRLLFRNGQVEYRRQPDGAYRGSRHPQGGEHQDL
jgi:hypothetical protein